MRVPWSWLTQWVALDLTPEELCGRLPFVGLEVEEVQTLGGVYDHIVVGEIRSIAPHPNADKLVLCQVDVGEAEARQIVCGAANMREGDRVPVALPGAVLGELKIKKGKFRGEASEGMMCSPRELGLGQDGDGLLILDRSAPVGAPAAEVLPAGETILELGITPNRSDCLSIRGVAREVGMLAGASLRHPEIRVEETGPDVATLTSVTLEDPVGCPRYTCRVVQGVRVGPSPQWLADAVRACGVRPINNIVDATNYVMLELGQPLHAFDMDRLAEGRIVVRRAQPGETATTLDEVARTLTGEMTVIADAERVVAVAGVMGGLDTSVTGDTVDLLLESAYFEPHRVRRTSRALRLTSESSYRFERGVDIDAVPVALDRLAQIIHEVTGGTVAAGRIDAYPEPHAPATARLRLARIQRVLGIAVPEAEVRRQLEALGCTVHGSGDTLDVTMPTWRLDLEREIDLIEEVARLTGYDKIPTTLPAGEGHADAIPEADPPLETRVRDALVAAGYTEVIGYRFGPATDDVRLGFDAEQAAAGAIRIVNPLSEDRAVMRQHVLPALLRIAGANQRQGNADMHVFEVGTVFRKTPAGPEERTIMGGVLAGRDRHGVWLGEGRPVDVYDAKGAWEAVAEALGLGPVEWQPSERPYFTPTAQAAAVVDDTVLGWVGEVRSEVIAGFDAQGPMFAFLMNLDEVASHAPDRIRYTPFSRFPPSLRARTYDVPERLAAAELAAAITAAGGAELERVELVDQYRGEKVPAGMKSLTYALTFRATDRTLTDADVDGAMARLDAAARERCSATVREA